MKQKTVYRLYIDYEKEETWLNEMAQRGWHLERFALGRYTFQQGEPGKYTYRIELLDALPNQPESEKYLAFLKEMEIDVVATSFRWVFLRKEAGDEPFQLYSDLIR